MPEPELFLLFVRRLNVVRIRNILTAENAENAENTKRECVNALGEFFCEKVRSYRIVITKRKMNSSRSLRSLRLRLAVAAPSGAAFVHG